MPLCNTHVYVGKKSTDKESPYFLVGLLLPDCSYFYPKEFNGYANHWKSEEFLAWTKENHKKLVPLAHGMYLHQKLDYSAEKDYKGSGKGFTSEGLNFDMNKLMKVFGGIFHVWAEMQIDGLLIYRNPDLRDTIKSAIKDVDLEEITSAFSEFYKKDKKEMQRAINGYINKIILYEEGAYLIARLKIANAIPSQYKKYYTSCIDEIIKDHKAEYNKNRFKNSTQL